MQSSSVKTSVMAIFVVVLADNGCGLEDTSFKAQQRLFHSWVRASGHLST